MPKTFGQILRNKPFDDKIFYTEEEIRRAIDMPSQLRRNRGDFRRGMEYALSLILERLDLK